MENNNKDINTNLVEEMFMGDIKNSSKKTDREMELEKALKELMEKNKHLENGPLSNLNMSTEDIEKH